MRKIINTAKIIEGIIMQNKYGYREEKRIDYVNIVLYILMALSFMGILWSIGILKFP